MHRPLERAPYPPVHVLPMPPPSFALPTPMSEGVHRRREGHKRDLFSCTLTVELQCRLRSHRHHRPRSEQTRRATSSHGCHRHSSERSQQSSRDRPRPQPGALGPVETLGSPQKPEPTIRSPRRATLARAGRERLLHSIFHLGSSLPSVALMQLPGQALQQPLPPGRTPPLSIFLSHRQHLWTGSRALLCPGTLPCV